MRIPLNEEHDIMKAKLKEPPTYMIPVFIGIDYADPDETVLEQNIADLENSCIMADGNEQIWPPCSEVVLQCFVFQVFQ